MQTAQHVVWFDTLRSMQKDSRGLPEAHSSLYFEEFHVIPLHRYACKERVHRISHGSFCFRLVSLVRSKEVRLLLLKCPRRKKTLTEDEMWEMEDKLAALNKELEESKAAAKA